jgi:hypothetical protein
MCELVWGELGKFVKKKSGFGENAPPIPCNVEAEAPLEGYYIDTAVGPGIGHGGIRACKFGSELFELS